MTTEATPGSLTREEAMERHHRFSTQEILNNLFEVLQPGSSLVYGALNYQEQVAEAACLLHLEFQAVSGIPLVQMLKGEIAGWGKVAGFEEAEVTSTPGVALAIDDSEPGALSLEAD